MLISVGSASALRDVMMAGNAMAVASPPDRLMNCLRDS